MIRARLVLTSVAITLTAATAGLWTATTTRSAIAGIATALGVYGAGVGAIYGALVLLVRADNRRNRTARPAVKR